MAKALDQAINWGVRFQGLKSCVDEAVNHLADWLVVRPIAVSTQTASEIDELAK
jgi:hypothetical protein